MADAPDIPEALAKPVGPLPLGVWLLAVGGGLAVAVFVRRGAQNDAAEAEAELAEDDPSMPSFRAGTGNGVDSTWPGAGNLYTQPSNPTSTAPGATDGTEPKPTTNEAWHALAIRRLLAKGYSPLLVDSALRDYLAGEQLSRAEQAVIAEALVIVGAPPVAPPPPLPGGPAVPEIPTTPERPDRTPPQRPSPRPNPPRRRAPERPVSYTVAKGDTLASIARRHKVTTTALYAKNRAGIEAAAKRYGRASSSSGKWIYPGTRLVIP